MTSMTGRDPTATPGEPLDGDAVSGRYYMLGGTLVAGLLVWVGVSAALNGGNAAPLAGSVSVAVASFAAARWVTLRSGWAVGLGITAAAAGFAVARADMLYGGPLRAPLGYSNAAGSLFLLAASGALLLAVRASGAWARLGALLACVGFLTVPWLNGTMTAAALSGLLVLPLLPRLGRAGTRALVAAGAVLLLGTLAATMVIGLAHEHLTPGALADRTLGETLSTRRAQLWADALELTTTAPLVGVGPRRFAVESPVARSDADTRETHHALLQLGAEAGVPALALGLLIGLWAFGWLWLVAGDRGTAVAVVALTAVAVHAQVDYVLQFPAVVAVAAALLGAGGAPRLRA